MSEHNRSGSGTPTDDLGILETLPGVTVGKNGLAIRLDAPINIGVVLAVLLASYAGVAASLLLSSGLAGYVGANCALLAGAATILLGPARSRSRVLTLSPERLAVFKNHRLDAEWELVDLEQMIIEPSTLVLKGLGRIYDIRVAKDDPRLPLLLQLFKRLRARRAGAIQTAPSRQDLDDLGKVASRATEIH